MNVHSSSLSPLRIRARMLFDNPHVAEGGSASVVRNVFEIRCRLARLVKKETERSILAARMAMKGRT